MTDHDLCKPVQVTPSGVKIKKWTLREDNHSHYHGVVSLADSPIYLELSWRRTAESPVHRVGLFRLNLPGLLQGGFVRYEPADSSGPEVRLRIVRAEGQFFVQVRPDGPRILMG